MPERIHGVHKFRGEGFPQALFSVRHRTSGIWALEDEEGSKPHQEEVKTACSEGVISSQGSYMIGEFCPKVFALRDYPPSHV